MGQTVRKGTIQELRVSAELIERGCEVYAPVMPDAEVDLMVVTPQNQTYRIQVKSVYHYKRHELRLDMYRKSRATLGAGSVRRGYTKVDFFIASHEGQFWIIPFQETRRQITLNNKPEYRGAWHLITGIQTREGGVVKLYGMGS